jgi:hypothetical protein
MGSGLGIEFLLNDLYVSCRLLQQHLFHLFPFDVSRLGGIRCSFLVSYPIKLAASAVSGWAEH